MLLIGYSPYSKTDAFSSKNKTKLAAYTHAEIIADKKLRIAYGELNFFFWFQYHYWFKAKQFHKDWMQSMQSDKNTFLEAFRASRKTTIARWYVCWCIAYKKEPSIIVQSYEDTLSWERVRECAKMLFQPSVVEDHGYLFPVERKTEDLSKRSLSNFESTNWVKVEAKSLWQTIRWTNTFNMDVGISARPTLLILDDIDVVKSVSNIDIINANEKKILWETIAALDPLRRKIIFLGNTINEDGIVPRFRNRYKNADSWNIFQQPLFDSKGKNLRPEVFTDAVVSTLKDDWVTSFNQNYLLIPSTNGNWVFVRSYFDYFLMSHFEDVDSPLKKNDLKCWIFIDPAFSTSKNSDDAVVLWVWEHKISKSYYLIEWYADTSAPSKTIQATIVMYNNMKSDWFEPKFLSVESVSINKDQTQFIKDLKAELLRHQINIPVYLYEPKTNKIVRIKDNLEAIMSQQGIKFNRNMRDTQLIAKLERQALEYPSGDHDDVIDCLAQAIYVFKERVTDNTTKTFMPDYWLDPDWQRKEVQDFKWMWETHTTQSNASPEYNLF